MEELHLAVQTLKSSTDLTVIARNLTSLLTVVDAEVDDKTRKEFVKVLIEGDIISSLKELLNNSSFSSSKHTVAQLVAELAKTDAGRDECVEKGLVIPLLHLLTSSSLQDVIQTCRALGNVCFDNDNGRHVISENGGVENLLKILRDNLNNNQPLAPKLRKVSCGFLFNLLNTHESVIEKTLSFGVIDILCDYLATFKEDEDLIQMILLVIEILADCSQGMRKILESKTVITIGRLLTSSHVSQELLEIVLQLFISLSDNDEIKLQLVNSELFQMFLEVTKKGITEEDETQLQKLTSDLIILLLTGDRSMQLLYDEGRGSILEVALNWMRSDNPQMQISGALAIGNIARTDAHCIELEKKGVTEELLKLLEKYALDDENCLLHHAVLSTLRNLAIPAANKRLMLRHDLLKRILPFGSSEMHNVQFKFLGTLRMIVDEQVDAAIELGTNDLFVAKLVEWCSVEQHEGVKGEANRLVAWLIKHSRDKDVMKCIVKHGGLPHVVMMVDAEHAVMKNEALVTLTLLSTFILDVVTEDLLQLNLISKLKLILDEKDSAPEISHNSLTLIKTLINSDAFLKQLTTTDILESIEKFIKHEDIKIQNLAKNVISEAEKK